MVATVGKIRLLKRQNSKSGVLASHILVLGFFLCFIPVLLISRRIDASDEKGDQDGGCWMTDCYVHKGAGAPRIVHGREHRFPWRAFLVAGLMDGRRLPHSSAR
jgi:hypothetical protein